MAQKRINDFDGAQNAPEKNNAPDIPSDGFDIFNFSDMDAASVERVQDDLDLDSFLNFDDLSETESEAPQPVEDEAASEPQPTPEEDEVRQAKRQARKARKQAAFAQLFGEPEVAAETAEPEPESDEPDDDEPSDEEVFSADEPDEEEYDEAPVKRGFFAKFLRKRAMDDLPEADEPRASESEWDADGPERDEDTPKPSATEQTAEMPAYEEQAPEAPDEQMVAEDEPENERRKGFFARLLRSDDPVEDDAPIDDNEPIDEKPSFFRSLFSRGHGDAEPADEEESEAASAGGKISFFARLTPEKEKFQALMQQKKEEERLKKAEDKKARSASIMPSDNTDLAERLGRRVRRSEELVYDSELDELDYIDRDDLPESRDYLPIRFRRYGKSGIGGGLMYAVFVISVSIILACFGWLCAADVLALSKDEVSAVVVVESYVPKDTDTLNEDGEPVDERGDVITCDVEQVAEALKEGDIINFKFLFRLFAKLSHASAKIDPGTYDVSTKLDYRALITEMQTGSDSQEITKITFPEGYRMEQIFQLLEDNDICDYDDLMDAAANHNYSYSWLDEEWYYEAEGDPTRLEGYLFPDTYEFYQGENAINVINRFLLRFHGLITQDMYQQAENLGITLHEAVIVASLIEKEAGANDDRSNFSSVIYNRLGANMPLGLDSTINYIQNTSTFNISIADTQTDSPYNTYLYTGLPKGPICNAGLASLNAALKPNSTNYWYWYAYDGSSYFFTNYSEQQSFANEHPYN